MTHRIRVKRNDVQLYKRAHEASPALQRVGLLQRTEFFEFEKVSIVNFGLNDFLALEGELIVLIKDLGLTAVDPTLNFQQLYKSYVANKNDVEVRLLRQFWRNVADVLYESMPDLTRNRIPRVSVSPRLEFQL